MTSPASYVFYHHSNSESKRGENTSLRRVFITDNKITVYEKTIIRTAKSGVLFEKINSQYTYLLCTNPHGQKYLKMLKKSAGGSITDASMETMKFGLLIPEDYSTFNENFSKLLKTTLSSWFNLDGTEASYYRDTLFFPVYADSRFPTSQSHKAVLERLQISTGRVTKLMRNSQDWSSFLKSLCGDTVQTVEDERLLKYQPQLLHVATLKLGMSISEFWKLNPSIVEYIPEALSAPDMTCIRFMIEHLPADNRSNALAGMLRMVRKYLTLQQEVGEIRTNRVSWYAQVPFSTIPRKSRMELAMRLQATLEEAENRLDRQVEGGIIKRVGNDTILIGLAYAVRRWYAQTVMELSLKSMVKMRDIQEKFTELFGEPYDLGQGITAYTIPSGETLLSISTSVKPIRYQAGLFNSFHNLVRTKPKSRGLGLGFNGFVDEDHKFISLEGGIFSLDDLMKIIEDGAMELDSRLNKLGRATTPENRVAYLKFGHKERKFKNTWQLYDWGVKDARKIFALKKCKITKKEEVQTYAQLPDEMFYEFIQLHSGNEINEPSLELALGW